VYKRAPQSSGSGFGRLGGIYSGKPVPKDIIVLLAVLFATFSLQFFPWTHFIPALLYLNQTVFLGQIWRLATYQFVGYGGPSLWFILVLLMVFWFGRDVFWRLGRRRFWRLLIWAGVGAGLAATIMQLVLILLKLTIPEPLMFILMQGQSMLLAILIAAFANLYGEATILFMFIIPIKARWFIWLEILFAFIGFLGTRDFAGFIGISTAVAITTAHLTPGGPGRIWRNWRRRLDRLIIEWKLARLRRKRSFDVVDGDGNDKRWGGDHWVN
jgi:hypothetical protein